MNYLKIAFRNILRNKTHSIINIAGLAVGIACCVIIMLYVGHELSYDRFYDNAECIYRVYVNSSINGQQSCNCKTAAPLGKTLVRNFPEVVTCTRIGFFGNHVIRYEDKIYRERRIYTADSNFFSVFSLPLIAGNPRSVLSRPNSIVMTQSIAYKYFGEENPVGKVVRADSGTPYMVTGVMKDFPENSSFRCDMLLSMSTYPDAENNSWLDMSYTTFVVLRRGTDPGAFQGKLKKIVDEEVGPQAETALGIPFREFMSRGNRWDLCLQPLASIYLFSQRDYGIDPNSEWGDRLRSDIGYVYMFTAVAVIILLLAIINFVNLTTARSESRLKEVGIKKTLGSDRAKLVGQFLTESTVIALLSVLISIALIESLLPFFNQLAGKNLRLEILSNAYSIPGLILFAVIVGMLAGSYPAFYLSSFGPAHLFKSTYEKRMTRRTLRSVLVVFQFTISIALIIGTLVIREQLRYVQNKDSGFKKDLLYAVINFGVPGTTLRVFEQEVLARPDVVSVTNSSIMFFPGIPGSGYLYNTRRASSTISSQYLDVDYAFLKTFSIPLLRGRFFSERFPSDTASVVINEAMVKECGAEDPVGRELLQIGGEPKAYRIIGVVKDFHYQSLHERIKPLALFLSPVTQAASIVTVRIAPGNVRETTAYIDRTWKKVTGGEDIFASFVRQDLERLYKSDERAGTVAAVFSGLAIFIACLGLFGLASFVTEQRTKEIGIRKVLGASVAEIVALLSKEFVKWVLVANVVAWPAAYYIMNNWLKSFAYRADMSPWVFIAAGILALAVAILTVSSFTIKAATANPSDSLRYE